MNILPASAESLDIVRTLWREYWKSLQLPPDFQNFEAELAGLPGLYSGPQGIILLAQLEQLSAGAVALRPLENGACEIKRLYVRPECRAHGLGRALLARILCFARERRYSTVYADTLPSMTDAQRLYAAFGFEPSAAYSAHPTPGAIYLKLRLTA